MPKLAKTIIAIALLPACWAEGSALWSVIQASGKVDTIWVATFSGAACWVVIYLLLPKPMWVYVFGHELSHAVWTWIMGGRVKKFKASADGGQVIVTKNNFVIALAPYFFPIYAVLVVLVFAIGNSLWGWNRFVAWFHLCLGAAYAFHVTLTVHILKFRQTDITSQGYLFSAVIIFLGNITTLLIGIPLLTSKVDVLTALGWWMERTGEIFHRLSRLL